MSNDNAVILCSRSVAPFGKPRADKLKIGDAEVSVYRLRKEIIPINERRHHPDKGYEIFVPPERADKWIQNFALMSERGHRVPAPPTHKDTGRSLGQWQGFSREPNERGGESLYGELQVIGDKTLEEVLNAGDVSILTRAGMRDDQGNTYDEAVEHVSITPFPALTKLGGWTIAASRGGEPENVRVVEVGDDTPEPEPAIAPVPTLSRVTMKLASESAGIPLRSRCAALVTLSLGAKGEEGWVTIEGVHIHFNGEGRIDHGPARLVGKTAKELPDHEHEAHAAAADHHASKAAELRKQADEHEKQAKESKAKADKGKASAEPKSQAAKQSAMPDDVHKVAAEVKDVYDRAGSDAITSEHINAAVAKLDGLTKAQLIHVAAGVDWRPPSGATAETVRKAIEQNIASRKRSAIRSSLLDNPTSRGDAGMQSHAAKEAAPVDHAKVSATVAKVNDLFHKMDHSEVAPSEIDTALKAFSELSQPEAVEAGKQLKVHTSPAMAKSAIVKQVRQTLHNQAEAASRVMTMREDR